MIDKDKDHIFRMERRNFLKVCAGVGLGLTAATTLPFAGRAVTGTRSASATAMDGPVDQLVDRWTYSTCQFCATGCGLYIGTHGGKPLVVRGNPNYPVNQGLLCQKAIHQTDVLRVAGRATTPLLRRNGRLEEVGWEPALAEVATRIRDAVDRRGPASVAIYNTGQMLQEEYYVLGKLARGALGTPHLDGSPRLCMASAIVGYIRSFGSDGPPNAIEDFDDTDFVMLIGANLHAAHPVLGGRLMARLQRGGCKFVVVDPRAIQFSRLADHYLPIRPGSDVALLNGMQHVLLRDGLIDRSYIDAHTIDFDAVEALVAEYPPERAAQLCGVPAWQIEEVARAFGKAQAAMSVWCMGINQQASGVAAVNQICNLHLLTGHIGRPGAGPFSLTGQPSSMDFRQAGGGPSLVGYRRFDDDNHRREVADAWGIDPARLPKGTTPAPQIWEAVLAGDIEVLWVICSNPAVSFPDLGWTDEVLKRVPTLIVQDGYYPVETAKHADVFLPAAIWGEKTGTFTNLDRRVNLLRQAVEPIGAARSDFDIVCEVGRRLGFERMFPFQTTEEAFDEFKVLTGGRPCDMRGITYERLEREGGLRWPVPDELHPGTARRYTDGRFHRPDGRARLWAIAYEPPLEQPDAEHPFWLNTGRVQEHWHTLTKTGRIPEIMARVPEAYVEVNPDDADALGIRSGQRVRVWNRRGEVELIARVTARVAPGSLFIPFHFGEQAANRLTGQFFDPFSRQPAFKHSAVALERA